MKLDVELPNPQNLTEEFEWTFPVGTVNENGDAVITSTDKSPAKVKFKDVIGSQRVTLKTKLGGRTLQERVFNVQVAYNKEVKTVYFAAKGNLWR